MPADRKKGDTIQEAQEIVVSWTDPLRIGDEIKELFRREGNADFRHYFDHVYPVVKQAGGGSVVARSPAGKLVMHIAAFPRDFRGDGDTVRGALLANHMVEESYRDFWSPIGFFRQVIEILDERGDFDFLFTDPGEGAFALFRAGGFDLLDSLRKYVFPLVPGWFSYLHLRFPVEKLETERMPWREGAVLLEGSARMRSGGAFRAIRTVDFYESWVRANLTDESEWLVLRFPGAAPDSPPIAQALLTPFATHRTLGIMDLMWDDTHVNLESLLYSVAVEARAAGFRKLATRALSLSREGEAIERCGFVGRADEQPIVTRVLTEGLTLPPPEEWLLTWMDGSK